MDLWTERYRPATIEDYVWRDPKQREAVEAWIASGSLPHLILGGVAGTGKCLGPNELISVRLDTAKLSAKQLEILNKYR